MDVTVQAELIDRGWGETVQLFSLGKEENGFLYLRYETAICKSNMMSFKEMKADGDDAFEY